MDSSHTMMFPDELMRPNQIYRQCIVIRDWSLIFFSDLHLLRLSGGRSLDNIAIEICSESDHRMVKASELPRAPQLDVLIAVLLQINSF